ncbi:MAG: ATP-binding protein, partial [Anaerolineae bacterium]|nr:ATP-binding protein [Anaerolineae bacterium]
LQSVLGCLGLAREALDEGESVAPYLEVALVEIQRIARIITQMRDLSRANVQEELKLSSINELVEQVLVLTSTQCEKKNVEVLWEPADDLPPVPVASDQIKQVFLNLVLNAIDAMSEGGKLLVRTGLAPERGMVSVVFSDTGVGIPQELLSQIFEPFFSTKPDGTGLGLSISHHIVTRHGGRIEVDSKPGVGSVFTVWLPVRPPATRP